MEIHWWNGHYGRDSCHKNERGLSFKESFLGAVIRKDDGWYFFTTDELVLTGPMKNVVTARRALEKAVGGEPIDI